MYTLIKRLVLLFPVALGAATLTVNSTDDLPDINPGDGICQTQLGTCSLRAAIEEANALPGTDTIAFAIGSGLVTISPASALPAISDAVLIDGTTQPGYAGSPLVVLNGNGVKGNTDGLSITAGNSTVQGLVVNNWSGAGISLNGNGGNVVRANYIGTDSSGTIAAPNAHNGLLIEKSPNNLIGGTNPADRNVISGNLQLGGLVIDGTASTGNVVQGNFIGTNAAGTGAIPNFGRGIAIKNAPQNLIGGTVPGARNLISGNRASGVRIFGSAAGNMVQGNYVGTDVNGQPVLGNINGIQTRSDNTVIGGAAPGAGNLVAGNRYNGVVFDVANAGLAQGNTIVRNLKGVYVISGTGDAILSNSIFNNTQWGIYLNPAQKANNQQSYPVLHSVIAGSTTSVSGTLSSTPGASFTVQFFVNSACDASGYGEGQTFLGQTVVTTDSTGNVSFTASLPAASSAGQVVTSTATDPNGNTSQFSACVTASTL